MGESRLRPTVIGLAGPIGSGKTSVAVRLAEVIECPIASFGAYFRHLAAQRGQPASREVLQDISEDGVRHPDVVAALVAEVVPLPFVLVYLDVPGEVRRERLAARDTHSANEMERFDSHSTERDGTRVRAFADIILSACGEVEETVAAITSEVGCRRRLEL